MAGGNVSPNHLIIIAGDDSIHREGSIMLNIQQYSLVIGAQGNGNKRTAFTLIELLIVIAIILILISIAMPNLLEAQLRATVARAKGELRSINSAMAMYHRDFGEYPTRQDFTRGVNPSLTEASVPMGLYTLTTPNRYISSIPLDPFKGRWTPTYQLNGLRKGSSKDISYALETWVLYSLGPATHRPDDYEIDPIGPLYSGILVNTYSPTNGTRSMGGIYIWGGDPFWIGVVASTADMVWYHTAVTSGHDAWLNVDYVRYLHSLPPSLR
jgi:type II secretion system protein G